MGPIRELSIAANIPQRLLTGFVLQVTHNINMLYTHSTHTWRWQFTLSPVEGDVDSVLVQITDQITEEIHKCACV